MSAGGIVVLADRVRHGRWFLRISRKEQAMIKDEVAIIFNIVNEIKDKLHGLPPEIIAVILARLVALLIVCNPQAIRKELLKLHVSQIKEQMTDAERELFGDQGFPTNLN
jgi:hypothetical protein